MYTRIVSVPPKKLVENGKPVFGTFSCAPERLDIRNVRRPFGVLPLPMFITNLRIRSRLSFFFCAGEYIGSVEFMDAKVFGSAELVLWNMVDGKKYAYRAVVGPRRRFIPHLLEHGICFVSGRKRYFRVSWDRCHKIVSFVFTARGDSVRPSVSGTLSADISSPDFCEMAAVLPAPVMRRCRGVYRLTAPIKGNIAFSNVYSTQKAEAAHIEGSSLFTLGRAYCKLRTLTDMVFGTGSCKGKSVTFCILQTSLEAVDPDRHNENILFVDGVMTPLPPVRITRPYGVTGKWIIQDTESMVDLAFTPVSDNLRILSIFILRTTSHTVYGKFEGVLLTAAGDRIVLKDFPGMAKKQNLRL